MSELSELLSRFPDSRAVAEYCEAATMPVTGAYCRLVFDRPPFAPNMMRYWAASNPTVTAQDFADMDAFFAAHPAMRDLMLGNLKAHCPHLWAKPLAGYVDIPRTELFADPIYASGGFLNRIMPMDETYRQCSIAQLEEWLAPYRDTYPWAENIDDCDDKGARIRGYAASCSHPRPSIGNITITGVKNGIPQGHTLNFTHCTDGAVFIENDGHVWPLNGDAFADWTGVVVQFGSL